MIATQFPDPPKQIVENDHRRLEFAANFHRQKDFLLWGMTMIGLKKAFFNMVAILLLIPATTVVGDLAFFDDFDGGQTLGAGISGSFSGPVTVESVQGFSGLGNGTNNFGGNLLRNQASGNPAPATVLTLSGLPSHTSIDLYFLQAMIDTWDGENPNDPASSPDFYNIEIDGNQVFFESFKNHSWTSAYTQSYVPPAGVLLVSETQLGWGTNALFAKESAYDMGLDPTFTNIPHSADTLTINWYASGGGWEGVGESFALENVQVLLNGTSIPEPSGVFLAFLAVGFAVFRRGTRKVNRTSYQVPSA